MGTAHVHGHWPERHRPRRRLQLVLTGVAVALLAAILGLLLARDANAPPGSGSGIAATQTRALAPFSRIELAGDNNLVVRVGGRRQSVAVHADSNLLRHVTTVVRSGTLVIAQTPGNLSSRTPMYVTIGVPSVEALTLTGAGNLSVSGIDGRSLSVALPGEGTVTASGTVHSLRVSLDGSGDAVLAGLTALDARATLAGAGTITLNARRRLEATLAGTGTILYGGDPATVVTHHSGTGTIAPSS